MHMGKCQEKGHPCWSTKESFLVKCNPPFITCWHQISLQALQNNAHGSMPRKGPPMLVNKGIFPCEMQPPIHYLLAPIFFASPVKQCTWENAKKWATHVGQQRNLSLWSDHPHSLLFGPLVNKWFSLHLIKGLTTNSK